MKRTLLAVLLLAVSPAAPAQPAPAEVAEAIPSADTLLATLDGNLTFDSRASRIEMTVVNPRRTRVYEMRTWGRGADQAAIEYLAPARDKGTRMLRKGDELWMYLPTVERTQKISGHMLRQGMMGSDLSYEDLLGASKLRGAYEATVTGPETHDGRSVWRVEMTAKDDGVAYPKRVALVDTETGVPLEQELYALSGMKLKTWTMGDVKSYGERHFPMTMVITDHVKEGSSTTIRFTELEFGVTLDEEVFGMRWLERR